MCVLLTHSMVRTCTAVGDVVHRTSAPQKSSSRSVGHPTGCWCQLALVDTWGAWGSAASSAEASRSLTLEECRFSCWVEVVCEVGSHLSAHAGVAC
jgi:hypothetical protein